MTNTPEYNVDECSSHLDFNLLADNSMKATRPTTIQKMKPKTNLPVMPNSVKAMRPEYVSRAGQHRWPQAKMVVMGGSERQVYNTEMLTVSTNKYDTKERSNHEENRVTLPDITTNGPTFQADGDADIPSRFTARSPSKLSQLPVFSKTLLEQSNPSKSKNKENIKLIKSIKFWRGTTPITQAKQDIASKEKQSVHASKNEKEHKDGEISKNDSILQTWTEQLSVFEETSKNKYFSWQMALRNRLLKHERMYYQEAVSRINKYRQQLRAKPAFGATGHREISGNIDQQLWKSLIQQHREKRPGVESNRPPGVSMSPTQEWKPYIANETAIGQKKPPYFGHNNASIEAKKKSSKANDVIQPTTSSSKRVKYQAGSELANSNYPVHGEALLKDDPKSTALPSITATSPLKPETDKEEKNDENDTDNNDEKASTRALLVDLKNQLLSKGDPTTENKPESTAPQGVSENMQSKTGLGMKLRLLLQNSAQNRQTKDENDPESARKTVTARKARSRMQSQQGGYRPTSRPRTIGDSSLPKIHNIMSTSLWKRHVSNKHSESTRNNAGIKHRLTLAGVANREVFSSSVIGIAQKHITKRTKQSLDTKHNEEKLTLDDVAVKNPIREAKLENPLFTVVPNAATTPTLQIDSNTSANDVTEPTPRSKKKKNPAYRLYTPATIQQHQFSSTASLSKIQEKENPQYKSLKLVTVLSEKQTSPPPTPLEQFRARQQTLKGKSKSKTGRKSKVMRIAVVEPPLTAKERFERQQEAERSRKRLSYNPTHAALSTLSNAILNSELDLRAPSSSPVDMFLRQYHYVHGEQESHDYWGLQKPSENYHHNLKTSDGVHETSSKERHPINQLDGLVPPRPPVQIEGFRLNPMQTHSSTKPSTAPKLKDLLDLQRLYQVMQKHGEAYTNGSSYFYSPSPNTGLEVAPNHQPVKPHGHQKNLSKMPFYYYPYQGDTNIQAVNEKEGAPLYVVTGANSLSVNRSLSNTKKSITYHPNIEHKLDERAATVPFRHVLNINKGHLPHWETAKTGTTELQRDSKHALTVIMPKTPGITLPSTLPISHLEQIQEHIMQ